MTSEAQIWIALAYGVACALVICHWSFILFAALYRYVVYPRRVGQRYDPSFLPHCTVIVPCKGTPRHARRNLSALLGQAYPSYNVVFTVESERDPAVPLIRSLVAENGRASLVVAGLASTCAQKIHNLLAAIEQIEAPEVLVFADNDVTPAPEWLRQLVLPLSNPKISITTGYRWLIGRNGTFSEWGHSFTNMFTYAVFASTSYWSGVGLWGGAMAIRGAAFRALDVAARWRESVVDDLSLSQLAMRRNLKSVLVPPSISPSEEVLDSFADVTEWVARQLLYAKAYHPAFWLFGLVLSALVIATYALLPVSVLGAWLTQDHIWLWAAGGPLIFAVGEVVAGLLYGLLGPIPDRLQFAALVPALRFVHLVSYLKTVGTWTIRWSGVRYTFDKRGKVVHIER
jgi:cellulose synthase/poly-beta-1,6-N-acetylglucosamine synthase-like glycosyltransferase